MEKRKKFSKALVTGASSGIGMAVARLLAQKNISLVLSGRNEKELRRLQDECGSQVLVEVIVADLTNADQLDNLLKYIEEHDFDLIINNAGFGGYGDAVDIPLEKSKKMMELNINAMALIALQSAKRMVHLGLNGVILNVSSAASFFAFPGLTVYSASKAFVNSFSQGLDEELWEKGIRVLSSCPGVVKTHFAVNAGGEYLEKGQGISAPMTGEFAAEEIWKQICDEKSLHVFDWRYRLMVVFAKFVPQKLLSYLVKRGLKHRRK